MAVGLCGPYGVDSYRPHRHVSDMHVCTCSHAAIYAVDIRCPFGTLATGEPGCALMTTEIAASGDPASGKVARKLLQPSPAARSTSR